MGPPIGHMIRHIRYEEFVALKSEGAGDFDGFLAVVDAAGGADGGRRRPSRTGRPERGPTIPPLPEALLARVLQHLRRRGLGVKNKVAVVTDPADGLAACTWADAAEAVAAFLLMQVRSFRDYGSPRPTGSARWSGAGPASRPSETWVPLRTARGRDRGSAGPGTHDNRQRW